VILLVGLKLGRVSKVPDPSWLSNGPEVLSRWSWHYDYPPCGYKMNQSDARVEQWSGQLRHRELYISRLARLEEIPGYVRLSFRKCSYCRLFPGSTSIDPNLAGRRQNTTTCFSPPVFHYYNARGIIPSLPCCADLELPTRI
jgi:hypothetical protein